MSSINTPRVATFKAGGAIAKGAAVKIGADNQHVVVCTAKTDKSIGVAMGPATTAEDAIEIALPGGGAKGLAGGTIAAGDLLAPTTDGSLIVTVTAGDRYVAVAMDAAVIGDILATEVVIGLI